MKLDTSIQKQYCIRPSKKTIPGFTEHCKTIKGIRDFRKQLQYYNNNICSLANKSSAGEITLADISFITDEDIIYLGPYIKEGYPYTKKRFTSNHEKIFLEERQKEIDRLKKGIDECSDYKSKLEFLMTERAGCVNLSRLCIAANVKASSIKLDWRYEYAGAKGIINLYPDNSNENEVYNLTIREHLINSIHNPEKYIKEYYDSFLFEAAKKEFEKRLSKASLPVEEVIRAEIEDIKGIYPYEGKASIDQVINKVKHTYKTGLLDYNAAFNFISLGGTIDYSIYCLDVMEIEEIIHLEELNKFYKYLYELSSGKIPLASSNSENNDLAENNVLESTIDDYLQIFVDNSTISNTDYERLTTCLKQYFESGKLSILSPSAFVKKGNKKKLAYALGELYKQRKKDAISFDYLKLLKQSIDLYSDEIIEKTTFQFSNLYKYLTTKTQ